MKLIICNWKKFLCLLLIIILIVTILLGWGCVKTIPTEAETGSLTAKEEGVSVPILMYHSILKDTSKSGKYTVTPTTIENDLLYLREHGYTTIVMADLIHYVYDNIPLPEKPVMITLDDGYYNNYTYLYPLLQKYQMKAVISIVGSYSQKFSEIDEPNPAYAYLTWNDILEMSQSGLVEFQNHSYDMHHQENGRKGAKRKWGESDEEYRKNFEDDLQKTQDLLRQYTGSYPTTFTYPYGASSKGSIDLIKEMGFLASLSCYEHENIITKDPECLYFLNRYNRPSGISTAEFMKKAGLGGT